MNDDVRFDDHRSAAWRNAIVEHARTGDARGPRKRLALIALIIAALGLSGGGVAYALSARMLQPSIVVSTSTAPPIERETPNVTLTPTPTPTFTPAPSEAPHPTLNGFDLTQVYTACDAAVPNSVWGNEDRLPPQPPDDRSFGIASDDGYAKEAAASDPNAIYANVIYAGPDGGFAWSALCIATGDPGNPTVTFIRTLD